MTSAISEIRASGGVLRAAWILAAGLAGTGIALLIARGDVWAALMALAGALVLWVATLALARNGERAALGAVVALAYGGRLALLAALHDVLAAMGKGGHLFGDDAEYEALAARMADYFHGAHDAVAWYGDANLMGAFVYLQGGLFALFGDQVTIVKVLNAVFAAALVGLLYDTTKRYFGKAAGLVAAVLGAAFPSLVLWSVLDLKDALALLLLGLVVWSAGRASVPRSSWWIPFVIAVVSLASLESVRRYLFLTVAFLLPLAFAVAPGRPMIRWGRAAAAGVTGLALWTASINGWLGPAWASDPQVRSGFIQAGVLPTSFQPPRMPTTLDVIERQRDYAAIGARTAFVGASLGERPLVVQPGERFVIEPPPSSAAPSAPATASSAAPSAPATASLEQRVVVVAPGSKIVLVTAAPSDGPTPTPPPSGTVVVRPGDVVQVAGAAPSDAGKPLQLQAATDRPIDVVVFPLNGIRQSPSSPVDGKPMRRVDSHELETLIAEQQNEARLERMLGNLAR